MTTESSPRPNLPGRLQTWLARTLRSLATQPRTCLMMLILPIAIYLVVVSLGQWINRGEIDKRTFQTAAAMQTADSEVATQTAAVAMLQTQTSHALVAPGVQVEVPTATATSTETPVPTSTQ